MPFQPLKLLVLFDDRRGYCARVIPKMTELLQYRAFQVDTHRIQDGPVDIQPYAGLIMGSPVFGLGLKGVGPTPELTRYVLDELPDLDDKKVAVFCVYEVRSGLTLDRMKGLIYEKGAQLVVAHGYSLLKPHRAEHILPTECMVRIR